MTDGRLKADKTIDVLHRPELDPEKAGLDPDNWRNAGNRLLKGARLAWQPLSESFRAKGRELEEKSDYFAVLSIGRARSRELSESPPS
jgi:hypothetical protein